MNVAMRRPMTLDQFLAWEERQGLRYEFDGFWPVAMAGGTAAHSAIQRNVIIALGTRLRGKPCQPHGSDLKILVDGRIRYPDVFVVCSPIPPKTTVVSDPVIVFEVFSDSTSHNDLVVKNAEYRACPSIQRYVVLEQVQQGALVFARKGDDWVSETLADEGAVLRLPELGIEIPLAEFYADVPLAAAAEAAEG